MAGNMGKLFSQMGKLVWQVGKLFLQVGKLLLQVGKLTKSSLLSKVIRLHLPDWSSPDDLLGSSGPKGREVGVGDIHRLHDVL